MRRVLLLLLVAVLLVGCRSQRDVTDLPEGASFTPATEATDFRVEARLILRPSPEQPGGGQGAIRIDVESLLGISMDNMKLAVFFPQEMVDMMLLPEASLTIPFSDQPLNLTPEQPSFGVEQQFSFPRWGQAEAVKAAASKPIRLRLLWDRGDRYLEIPASEIAIIQADE